MSIEKFNVAREMIERREFTAARAILKTMPDDPTARDWLAELDRIDPPAGGGGGFQNPVQQPPSSYGTPVEQAPPAPEQPQYASSKPPSEPMPVGQAEPVQMKRKSGGGGNRGCLTGCLVVFLLVCILPSVLACGGTWWLTNTTQGRAFAFQQAASSVQQVVSQTCENAQGQGFTEAQCNQFVEELRTCTGDVNAETAQTCFSTIGSALCVSIFPDDPGQQETCSGALSLQNLEGVDLAAIEGPGDLPIQEFLLEFAQQAQQAGLTQQ